MLGKNRKKDWELEVNRALKEVERILKEGRLNSRYQAFVDLLEREEVTPPEDWQEIFNAFFDNLIDELPAFACCILAFKAGVIWQLHFRGVIRWI